MESEEERAGLTLPRVLRCVCRLMCFGKAFGGDSILGALFHSSLPLSLPYCSTLAPKPLSIRLATRSPRLHYVRAACLGDYFGPRGGGEDMCAFLFISTSFHLLL